jgi:aldehyde dehydrogenase (NAD+)
MRKEEMKKYQHFINGEYTDPDSGEWFDSENPYTGEVWAQIAKGNAADIDKAGRGSQSGI